MQKYLISKRFGYMEQKGNSEIVMTKKIDIAIVGATGAVGEVILDILMQRQFPVGNLFLLASPRSQGTQIEFSGREYKVDNIANFDFTKVQMAIFAAGSEISARHAESAAEAGCIVIDNTSCFRYEDDIPLIVPEVNPEMLEQYRNRNIISNPNCSTIQMVVALKPIHDAVGIERINVATYQAVSGAGRPAIEELIKQCGDVLNGRPGETEVFSEQIAFNVIPHIDVFQDNGYTREEMKMVWETKKILKDDTILVNPTAVRVPVLYGHSEAINIETKEKISAEQASSILKDAPGVVVVDTRKPGGYPSPFKHASGHDAVYVGRIREDLSHPRGLNLWVVADNVRKGAALNAIQIAELLIENGV